MEKEIVKFDDILIGTFTRWKIVIVLVLIAILGVVGLSVTNNEEISYESNVNIFIKINEENQEFINSDIYKNIMPNSLELIKTNDLLQSAIDSVGIDIKASQIKGSVSVKNTVNTNFLNISYKNNDEEISRKVLEAIVEKFSVAINQYNENVTAVVAESIQVSKQTEGLNVKKIAILAIVGAVFLGLFISFIMECLDKTFKTVGELERTLELKAFGVIPKESEKNNVDEAYNFVATRIKSLQNSDKAFMVTSSINNEGINVTSYNLAKSLAKGNNNVLLIDCNLRNNDLDEIVGYDNKHGFASLDSYKDIREIIKNNVNGIDYLPHGEVTKDVIDILDNNEFNVALKNLKEEYDYVIVNSPAFKVYTDAQLISNNVDGVILIVKAEKTKKDAVVDTVEVIKSSKVNLVGVILKDINIIRNRNYFYK